MREETGLRRATVQYLVFLGIFLGIVGAIVGFRTLLIAPPYAVTAYLIVFNRGSKYADLRGIVVSYLVVIASSEAFEFALGVTVVALVVNVALVALFISFSPYSHPPAIALTIFSYLVHDPLSFVVTSIAVLGIVAVADVLVIRWKALGRLLGDPAR